jgi:hypothetical protein
MAGSATITYSKSRAGMKSVTWAWTSDASGNVNGTDTVAISGEAVRFVTKPDGTLAPTDLYDVVVNDAQGIDLAAGSLANRATATTQVAFPVSEVTVNARNYAVTQAAFDGPLSLSITNAGNAKSGTLVLYYR